MNVSLDGRTAVVTGASSGLGAATAVELAECGAVVLAVGRDEGRLAATASRSERIHVLSADLADPGSIGAVRREVERLGGRCDVLVHAAGHFENSEFAVTLPEEFDRLYRVHVLAPAMLTQALLPAMPAGAHVVFFASTVAHRGFAPYAAYSCMKGAVEALSRALAVELAPGIRVNCIVPGFHATPMMTDQFDAVAGLEEAVRVRTPLGFIAGPERCASLIAFLSSDEGGYTTGQSIVIDGGWTALGWQQP